MSITVHGTIEFLHIVACFLLIGVVLLQADQGEGLSGAFGGGGSYALFGKRGATGFIAQLTSAAAIVFMVSAFSLTYLQMSPKATTGQASGAPLRGSVDGPATGAPLANQ